MTCIVCQCLRTQGYVPQHDILIGQLSVWHTMVYAAMLRMPTLLPHKVKIEK